MNIQGLNPLSLLSSVDGAGASAAGLTGEGGVFSATLLDQLAQLQNSLLSKGAAGSAGLAELQQQFGALGGDTLNSQNMQDFAALFGNSLPTATKLKPDINLDDTLHTLADVLQYLQSLEAAPTAQQSPVLPTAPENKEDLSDIAAENAELAGQQVAAAAMTAGVQVQQAADNGNNANDALKTALATSQALSAVKKNLQSPGMETKQDVLAALSGDGDGQKGQILDGGFAKTLAAHDGGSQQCTQDTATGNAFQSEQAATTKSQTGGGEADSSISRMTADIAQLNKSVNNAAQTPAPAIEKHLTHQEWNTELGEKLLWMHKQAVPSAEIRLNPEHLGPISIKIDVNQDQATVAFTAQHAAVRDAIEAAIPKLREMLGGQNLNLADVNVSQQQSEQKQGRESFQMAGEQNRGGNSQSQNKPETPANESAATILDEIAAGRAIASNGLLSLFA